IFYSNTTPPSLPSFPTRRSSDLVVINSCFFSAVIDISIFSLKLNVFHFFYESLYRFKTRKGFNSAPSSDASASGYPPAVTRTGRSEEHTSELQSRENLVCRLLLE